ncbi:hypothetical protein TNCV_4871891 [Trichonephila clavipes]|nr:hypothetical protein TNCV_4871891 [Trichonephila clavipes]
MTQKCRTVCTSRRNCDCCEMSERTPVVLLYGDLIGDEFILIADNAFPHQTRYVHKYQGSRDILRLGTTGSGPRASATMEGLISFQTQP